MSEEKKAEKSRRGALSGWETAIIMVAFVVVGGIFVYLVLSSAGTQGPLLEAMVESSDGWTLYLENGHVYQVNKDIHCDVVGEGGYLRCNFPIVKK